MQVDDSVPSFAPPPALGGKDARTLARELLAMSEPEFSAAFRGSPTKWAKRSGLARNAAVVLGNVGSAEDVEVLTRALVDSKPLVGEHAMWALERIHRSSTARRVSWPDNLGAATSADGA